MLQPILKKSRKSGGTIGGRRKDRDPTRFNRNRNIPEIRESLGINKHLVLVVNPNSPPSYERLLAELHGFANVSAQTRSINLWAANPEHSRHQNSATSALTPQELWHRYSQGTANSSDIQRQVIIAKIALQNGLKTQLPEILACDPFVQKIQREQGGQKARKHIQIVIQAVSVKFEASAQPRLSPKRTPKRDTGIEP